VLGRRGTIVELTEAQMSIVIGDTTSLPVWQVNLASDLGVADETGKFDRDPRQAGSLRRHENLRCFPIGHEVACAGQDTPGEQHFLKGCHVEDMSVL